MLRTWTIFGLIVFPLLLTSAMSFALEGQYDPKEDYKHYFDRPVRSLAKGVGNTWQDAYWDIAQKAKAAFLPPSFVLEDTFHWWGKKMWVWAEGKDKNGNTRRFEINLALTSIWGNTYYLDVRAEWPLYINDEDGNTVVAIKGINVGPPSGRPEVSPPYIPGISRGAY